MVIKLVTALSVVELPCRNNSLVFCVSQQATASWLGWYMVGVDAIHIVSWQQNINIIIKYI